MNKKNTKILVYHYFANLEKKKKRRKKRRRKVYTNKHVRIFLVRKEKKKTKQQLLPLVFSINLKFKI